MAFGRNVQVTIAENGDVTTETNAIGGLKSITDPVTTIFEKDTALTGPAKYVQLGLVALAGNMLGVHASTGNIGVAATRGLKFNFKTAVPAAAYRAPWEM